MTVGKGLNWLERQYPKQCTTANFTYTSPALKLSYMKNTKKRRSKHRRSWRGVQQKSNSTSKQSNQGICVALASALCNQTTEQTYSGSDDAPSFTIFYFWLIFGRRMSSEHHRYLSTCDDCRYRGSFIRKGLPQRLSSSCTPVKSNVLKSALERV